MSAEMAARRIAAAAVVADFRAELARHPQTRQPDGSWAYRLANEVGSLLAQLDTEESESRPPVLVLSASNEAVLAQALADAIAHRDPAGACTGCEDHPAGLCEDHADDLDKTDQYIALARELGIEMDRGGELND